MNIKTTMGMKLYTCWPLTSRSTITLPYIPSHFYRTSIVQIPKACERVHVIDLLRTAYYEVLHGPAGEFYRAKPTWKIPSGTQAVLASRFTTANVRLFLYIDKVRSTRLGAFAPKLSCWAMLIPTGTAFSGNVHSPPPRSSQCNGNARKH